MRILLDLRGGIVSFYLSVCLFCASFCVILCVTFSCLHVQNEIHAFIHHIFLLISRLYVRQLILIEFLSNVLIDILSNVDGVVDLLISRLRLV